MLRRDPVFGPFSAGTKKTSSATRGLTCCIVRYAEIELTMYDSLPATSAWLLDAGFQAKTSFVIASSNRPFMYVTAATVSGESRMTCSRSSWIAPP